MKNLYKLTVVLICLILICGCSSVSNNSNSSSVPEKVVETKYPYDFTSKRIFDVDEWYKYIPVATVSGVKDDGSYFQQNPINNCTVLQGCTTDGKYTYMCLNDPENVIDGKKVALTIIVKVDMSNWTPVAQSEPLELFHANSAAYNPNTNEILVSNSNGNFTKATVVDADTLKIKNVIDLGYNFSGITYNEKNNVYLVRPSGTRDFAILDNDYTELGYYKGVETGLGYQNIDCDDDFIYILDSGVLVLPGTEIFSVYDWDGNFRGVYRLDSVSESESIFNYNGVHYVGFYTGGGRIFKLDFDKSLLS